MCVCVRHTSPLCSQELVSFQCPSPVCSLDVRKLLVCAWWVVIVSGEAVRPAALVIVTGGPTDAVCLDGSPPGVQDPSGNGADQVEAAHAWMLNVGELSDIVDTDSGVHIILRTA